MHILQVAKESKTVFLESTIAGVQVRQCSCDKQRECVIEMKKQAAECLDPCWSQFRQITTHPEDLRSCLDGKDNLLQSFLTCFEQHVDSCVGSENGPHIPKTNISELFRLGELAITSKADSLGNAVSGPMKRILDAAGDFAVCVKDCFLAKNKYGFCFDRKKYGLSL
ncbi:unnamed protein product [Toxocara canis]|uniref:CX9C domain-containing protein n=1 Tax=Toxocara canis TaxID=6265 RepID=A0A183VG27_TOXCA|nr:unnamed protein product [Toxocara canis]